MCNCQGCIRAKNKLGGYQPCAKNPQPINPPKGE